MSIVTKTGDGGTTSLMYKRRVSKCPPRVCAEESAAELSAAMGAALATTAQDLIRDNLLAIQNYLVTLMGVLATAVEDLERYDKDGFAVVTPQLTRKLDEMVRHVEAQN